MEKEKFISKFNIKDYNNQLENILAQKTFSEATKNLLLSMLYKIENAYNDYNTVNIETKSKKEILEEILEIIQENCDNIEIIKEKKSESFKKDKKIVTYLNEKTMLFALFELKNKNFRVEDEYEIIKPSIECTMNEAYSIAGSEIIRDFDGWSWNITVKEIENITANLIYQTLKILVGNSLLIKWQEDDIGEDYIIKLQDELVKRYKEEIGEKLFKLINQIAIINYIKKNDQERKRLIEIQNELQIEFDEIDDKRKYLEKLGKSKKKIVAEIKKIDQILNNDKLLKEEFITRNQVLDMNHRIFSLSDLVDVIQEEREKLIKELNICSRKMEPLNFIKEKNDLENRLTLIKELELEKNKQETYNKKTEEFLKLVCQAIKIQIDNTEDKEKIINLIYKIRYYGLIYVKNNKQIKDIIKLDELQKDIITKACKQKIVNIFSKNIKENYEIVKNILKTDIIELEKIYLKFKFKEEKHILEIYDEENIYASIEIPELQDLNVKLGKKVKVMI